jgi:hypothetical protein
MDHDLFRNQYGRRITGNSGCSPVSTKIGDLLSDRIDPRKHMRNEHENAITRESRHLVRKSSTDEMRVPSPKKQPCRGGKREQCCKLEIAVHPIALGVLFALQCFHVLFLALHDWIPLGTFNDVKAVREANPGRKLVAATLISLIPFAIGLAASAAYFGRAYPTWLFLWLWISYGLLFVGELTAWWIPYLFHPEPERAARYQVMFGATHALLPERNGIRPNTLHVILHILTLTTLVVLGALTVRHGWPHS